jgi:hypothetical protein
MRFAALLGLPLALAACSVPATEVDDGRASGGDDSLTGTTSVERAIHFEGYVYVPVASSDDVIRTAIAREVKTAIGALRQPKVSINDRAARSNLDPAKWSKVALKVRDASGSESGILKVTYRYDDRAVVSNSLASKSTVDFTVLADDYAAHLDPLNASCVDEKTDADSLWYHFQPQSSACRSKIAAEASAIDAERRTLPAGVIGPKEAARWFLPVTAKLDAPKLPGATFSPEYDRLLTGKDKVVIYAFFGVDSDETNPDDALAIEAARFVRSMLRGAPNFRPVHTDPFVWLLDFDLDGGKVEGVTYDQAMTWIVDRTGFPTTDPGKQLSLRKQALAKLAERWIYWDLPLEVNGRATTIEVRNFFGYEDGSPDARQHAQWRYLEAFWYGDVFLYNGHSHFGHGPLEPTMYGPGNFNDRYQIALVNSCISFNYYHQDFLEMKPGGSKNLDMIVNGLPSYVWGGGEVAARFVTGLVSGKQPTYSELLGSMRLDTPWGEKAYDPMRVVDGELDNTFDRSKTPLTVKALPPVY